MVVTYICNKCKKAFTLKTGLTRHVNKKFPCKNADNNVDLNENNINNNNLNLPIVYNNENNLANNDNNTLNDILNTLKKLSENMEILKENNNELKNKILEIKPSNIKLINNITINITEFGKEDLNFIDNETCKKKLMYTGFDSIQNYVMLVHFNKDKPEYQNIYISNKKNKNEIMVNNGNKWIIAKTNDIIEKIFFKSISFFKGNLEKLQDNLIENKTKGIKRLINNYDEDENKIIKELSKDIVLIIYNNRDISTNKLITNLS
jgi:hypothetical protein